MQARYFLDYNEIVTGQPRTLHLMLQLHAGAAPEAGTRRPINLSLVIDRSGSMAGQKIEYTRQAAQLLVQNLSPRDVLSIVLYNDIVETLLMPEKVQRKDIINQMIARIKPGGTTNLSGGWLEGCDLVARNLQPDMLNRVILMSDGLANRGVINPEQLVTMSQQKHGDGITTTTMGLGRDFNEDLLMQMASAGGGAFYFIESPEVTPGIFQEELRGLLKLVGQNLSIAITPTPYVTGIRQMNAYPEEKLGGEKQFRLGDIYGEEAKTLMLELHIPAMKKIGEVQIATLRFEYDELTGAGTEHKSMEMSVGVNVKPPELAPGTEAENAEVTRSVLLLKAAEARRQAIALADEGKFGEAAKTLRNAAEEIRQSGVADDVMREERGALISQASDMDRGAAHYKSYSRKSMSTQVYFTGRGSHENTQAFRLREEKRKQNNAESVDNRAQQTGALNPEQQGESRKTYFFENPLADAENVAPPQPVSKLPPTHLRWRDQLFALTGDLIRIGRAPQNEIIIDATGVSRFHCQIKREGDQLILEDLDSTNGTHLHGRPLTQPHTLHEGDVAYLCDQRIIFERQ